MMAIDQLLYQYCHALDRGSIDEVVELFHRDAVLLPAYQSDARLAGTGGVTRRESVVPRSSCRG